MHFEFLWTDKCFLIVMSLALILTLFSLRKQQIRRSFSIIIHKPLALSAGIFLVFFLVIAVLDSIHFDSGSNANNMSDSVLDKLVAPIGSFYEKTYSAPLALQMFVSETQMVDGVMKQRFPRLEYVPAEIKTKTDRARVINRSLLKALSYCVAMIVLFWFMNGLINKSNQKNIFYLSLSGYSVFITLSALIFLIVFSYDLSRSFHILGTGQIGQDIFYFTLKSIRTGLIIGLLTTLFMLPLAVFLGISAGYFGGWVDDVIQYVYTTLSSIPGVLLITASVLSLQAYITSHPEQFPTLAASADARLLALCFILGVTSWTSLCRLLRAETLKLREVDYVMAAKALGSNWITIIRKHLLPNVMHIVIITLVLDFSFLVMAEAVLSYVGVGVSPMTISWGNMINGARLELARDPVVWWPMFAAFLFMFVLVLAINLFADAVRDAFDPHQSHV